MRQQLHGYASSASQEMGTFMRLALHMQIIHMANDTSAIPTQIDIAADPNFVAGSGLASATPSSTMRGALEAMHSVDLGHPNIVQTYKSTQRAVQVGLTASFHHLLVCQHALRFIWSKWLQPRPPLHRVAFLKPCTMWTWVSPASCSPTSSLGCAVRPYCRYPTAVPFTHACTDHAGPQEDQPSVQVSTAWGFKPKEPSFAGCQGCYGPILSQLPLHIAHAVYSGTACYPAAIVMD